jgi:hypothetical protein
LRDHRRPCLNSQSVILCVFEQPVEIDNIEHIGVLLVRIVLGFLCAAFGGAAAYLARTRNALDRNETE